MLSLRALDRLSGTPVLTATSKVAAQAESAEGLASECEAPGLIPSTKRAATLTPVLQIYLLRKKEVRREGGKGEENKKRKRLVSPLFLLSFSSTDCSHFQSPFNQQDNDVLGSQKATL